MQDFLQTDNVGAQSQVVGNVALCPLFLYVVGNEGQRFVLWLRLGWEGHIQAFRASQAR